MHNNQGVTFIETIIVVALVSIIVSAVVMSTISSLKSANFANNKSQATKYAQEGMELVRRQRDLGWYTFYANGSTSGTNWCIDKDGNWTRAYQCSINIDQLFSRSVVLTWDPASEKMNVDVTVEWQENGTRRQSKISSFLTKWR